MKKYTAEQLNILLDELLTYPHELPWLEWKRSNNDIERIGKYISALANSACIEKREFGYMIWGIDDETHEIVGTNNDLQNIKKGNQEIQSWLINLLSPNTNFEFYKTNINNKQVGLLIIYAASNMPVTFKEYAYIKVGSYTCKLNKYPNIEKQLWNKLTNTIFEEQFAKQNIELDSIIQLLDVYSYFDLKKIPIPTEIKTIIHYLKEENIIVEQDNGLYAITNLGAILLAKDLSYFPKLSRKAVRIIQYSDKTRLNINIEDISRKGYAADFERIINFIKALIPSKEIINDTIRETHISYPMLAIREIIANALIHQDFFITGTGPTIEIFSNRIEITNPGLPLVDIKRIIDNPPKSRNEKLASLMRKFGLCEEL